MTRENTTVDASAATRVSVAESLCSHVCTDARRLSLHVGARNPILAGERRGLSKLLE